MGVNVNDLPQSLITKLGLKAGEVISEQRLGELVENAKLSPAEQDAVYQILNGAKNEGVGDVVTFSKAKAKVNETKEAKPGLFGRIWNGAKRMWNGVKETFKEHPVLATLGTVAAVGAAWVGGPLVWKALTAGAKLLTPKLGGAVALGIGAGALFASCTNEDDIEPYPPVGETANSGKETKVLEVNVTNIVNVHNNFSIDYNKLKNVFSQALSENNSNLAQSIASKLQPLINSAVAQIGMDIRDAGSALGAVIENLITQIQDLCGTAVDIKDIVDALAVNYGVNSQQLNAQLTEVIRLLTEGNEDRAEMKEQLERNGATQLEILQVLKNMQGAQEAHAARSEQLQAITIALLKKATGNISAQLNAILGAIRQGNVNVEKAVQLLERINAKLETSNKNDKDFYNQILNLLNAMRGDNQAGNDALLERIDHLIDLAEQNKIDMSTIVELLKKLNGAVEKNTLSQENANKWLAKIDADIQSGNKDRIACTNAILAAITKLGNTASSYAEAILNKIGDNSQQLKDITALLQLINKNVVDGNATQAKKADAILAAINKYGAENIAKLQDIYDKIPTTSGTPSGKDYEQLLNLIISKLDKINGDSNNNFALVLDALDKLINGQTPPKDYEEILNKILNAIKDHKVEVDITGEVTCHCDCHGGQNNEGIQDLIPIDAVNNMLGVH